MAQPPRSCSDVLSSQTIDENGPGSILADFEMLLAFVEEEAPSTGKHHLLPMARLFEIDSRMTKPLRPRLSRPQQKSFPHINGLYLLLRATRLVIPEGQGKTGSRLSLDPAMHEQWLRLNATERYFILMEAWLRRSSWEVVGLRGDGWLSDMALGVRDLWRSIPPAGLRVSQKERRPGEFLYGMERASTLALLELFGLMTVEREEPEEGQSWRVAEVRHTPFGDAILGIVLEQMAREIFTGERCAGDFGAWQTSLRPYFPQWVNNLELPVPEFRDGVYYFKVSLGKPWRRIAISAEATLDEFAACIIRAFDFDGDHLYAFNLTGRDGRQLRVVHPCVEDAEEHTDEVAIGCLPLDARQSMEFQYDFGTNWQFEVALEKIEPDGAKTPAPTIVESRGEAPAEYDFDDEW